MTRESASGAVHFAVATRALAAKRYEPVARGVIQGESGLEVVPNFKRFKKVRRGRGNEIQVGSHLVGLLTCCMPHLVDLLLSDRSGRVCGYGRRASAPHYIAGCTW